MQVSVTFLTYFTSAWSMVSLIMDPLLIRLLNTGYAYLFVSSFYGIGNLIPVLELHKFITQILVSEN